MKTSKARRRVWRPSVECTYRGLHTLTADDDCSDLLYIISGTCTVRTKRDLNGIPRTVIDVGWPRFEHPCYFGVTRLIDVNSP